MTLDELIQYLRLRDFKLRGQVEREQMAYFDWSVDSNVMMVVYWSAEHDCFVWRLSDLLILPRNIIIKFKPLPLEQDIWVDRMFDALNAQIDHLYKWIFPAHSEDF